MNAPLDIKSYMLEVGRRARAAAREVARADTATKNRALIAAANAAGGFLTGNVVAIPTAIPSEPR